MEELVGAFKAVLGLARKLFPDHWSFLLGEVALYSFIVLIISGTFLTMFFVPSMAPIEYTGPYEPLQGQMVSEAFNYTMELSFEMRDRKNTRLNSSHAAISYAGLCLK